MFLFLWIEFFFFIFLFSLFEGRGEGWIGWMDIGDKNYCKFFMSSSAWSYVFVGREIMKIYFLLQGECFFPFLEFMKYFFLLNIYKYLRNSFLNFFFFSLFLKIAKYSFYLKLFFFFIFYYVFFLFFISLKRFKCV